MSTQAEAAAPGGEMPASAAAAAELTAQESATYRNAIGEARAGKSAAALEELRSLAQRHPERSDLQYDLVVVLGWAGRDAEAMALAGGVDPAIAPAYVVEGLAGSARRQKNYTLAESLYARSAERFPGRVEPQAGLVLTLADQGRLDEAAKRASELRERYPHNASVLEAYAEVATTRGDYFAALSAYQAMRADTPDSPVALRGEARTLARLGAPQLAVQLAGSHPGALSEEEVNAYQADSTAHRIRWGTAMANQGHGPERFAELDRALAGSDAAGARALDQGASLSPAERQMALDRISALRGRYRMREAVALYEALAARPEPMPPYAKADAAAACLYLHQPERARDLYREVAAVEPDNTGVQIGLFYALAESEDHAAALAQIEKLAAATPKTINAYSAATTEANPQYLPVQTARAMAPLLANRPGEAWRRMRVLSAEAPFNMEVGVAYGSTMAARGWPRLAEQQLRSQLTLDPYDSGALGEHAEALLEMRDYRGADAELAKAQAAGAEDERVVRAAYLARVHNMWELNVEAGYGRSSDAPTGNRDFEIDTHLYSSPFNYNYRAFLHTYDGLGSFDAGTGRYDRAGAGLEYRSTRYLASAEVTQDLNRDRTGLSLAGAYTPDDFWTLRAFAESSSTYTPVQARLF
ncbi:MAG TPA: poly-beta-1,6 N-acetyl-D-glucosamine export porin PgaA, partial [Burkholderiales bacterium]|nr:poly-beta-1,6 N-acetyl-D-glucosamine export porin PgaA [Burkholderiales bacterium]